MDSQICILIPAYQPDEKLVQLLEALQTCMPQDCGIVVVDDGSNAACQPVFDKAKALDCTVLQHVQNQGKGRALKTGIAYAKEHGYAFVATADADGQHRPEDIVRLCEEARQCPQQLVLGVRDLHKMPLRSKTGNFLTMALFGLLYGRRVTDTQTGLRVIPADFYDAILQLGGERYEFEMNMLIWCAKRNVPMREVIIQTVYLDDNASSHFHPIRDGLRIYKLLFGQISMFTLSSLLSFCIDFLLFALLNKAAKASLLLSTVGARVVSSAFNYVFNSRVVFRHSRGWKSLLSYYGLVLLILALNYGVLYCLTQFLHLPTLMAKLITELLLYFVSFRLQQGVVFRKKAGLCADKTEASADSEKSSVR